VSTARYIVGDSLTVLRSMEDASVDLVLSSPPFLALRSYLPADHPDKAKEIGSEPTPGAFIDTLLDIVEECRRVLAPHGSLAFELGDTYSGSGGAGGDYGDDGMRAGQPEFQGSAVRNKPGYGGFAGGKRNRNGTQGGPGWPLDKSLCLIPELFRIALVYGFNPLTGRQTPRWRARNVVRWHRPNPPVGALGDKFRPATSDMVIVCMSGRRYFDLDAARTPLTEPDAVKRHSTEQRNPRQGWDSNNAEIRQNPAGAPPLDTWVIPTAPYKGAHYATFPPALCERPIKAMCPIRVCRRCGEPSRRITEATDDYAQHLGSSWADRSDGRTKADGRERNSHSGQPVGDHIVAASRTTLGWTDCGHDDWRNGVTLDPFAGSGTTLAVATGHGRDAVGIDLDERNADLAYERIGMFLTVEHHESPEAVA